MSLLVVGTVALDSVETPHGDVTDALGGSATFFSYAASFFTPVRLIAIIGEDFPQSHRDLLESRGVDTSGLIVQSGGQTFRWRGKYEGDMNAAQTLETHLNVLTSFDPTLPEAHAETPYVFLANIDPNIQIKVLRQAKRKRLAVADTMNFWIETQRDALLKLWREIDGVVLNDGEARLITQEVNLVKAGRKILDMGPRFVIIKKGEHGSMFLSATDTFTLPAFPMSEVVDPTGAGDSFAGGIMGYLAATGRLDSDGFKRAMAFGTVVASFNVEDFSLRRFQRTKLVEIEHRFRHYQEMLAIQE